MDNSRHPALEGEHPQKKRFLNNGETKSPNKSNDGAGFHLDGSSNFNPLDPNQDQVTLRSEKHHLSESVGFNEPRNSNECLSETLHQPNKELLGMKVSEQGPKSGLTNYFQNVLKINSDRVTIEMGGGVSEQRPKSGLTTHFQNILKINSNRGTIEMDEGASNNEQSTADIITKLERDWEGNKNDVILRVKLLRHYLNSGKYNEIILKFSGLDNLNEECLILIAQAKLKVEDLQGALEILEKAERFYLPNLANDFHSDLIKRILITNIYRMMVNAFTLNGEHQKAREKSQIAENLGILLEN